MSSRAKNPVFLCHVGRIDDTALQKDMRIKLPYEWKDLTLGELQAYMLATDDVERMAAMSNQSKEQVRNWSKSAMEKSLKHVAKLMDSESFGFEKRIEIDGERYGLIPDWGEFTLGEWIDCQNAMQDFWKNAHKLMAILYRPIAWEVKKQYGIKPYTAKEDAEVMRKIPAQLVSGAVVFFWSIGTQYSNRTQRYSLGERLRSSVVSGAGITRFTNWLTETFSRWMPSLSKRRK